MSTRRSMKTLPSSRPPPKPAVLGVDIGTTATRASLMKEEWRGQDDRPPIIVVRPNRSEYTAQFKDCDMPATAFPFDTRKKPEDCLGYATESRRQQLPLKMFMYFQRAKDLHDKNQMENFNKVLDSIPQVAEFWKEYAQQTKENQAKIARHLEAIFIAHLHIVRRQSEDKAKTNNMEIKKIAATIPPNWDSYMQVKYVQLLAQVMKIHEDNITILSESEAICHYLLRLNKATKRQDKGYRVIVADFGGHTLNACTVEVLQNDEDADYSFFFDSPVCEHGGSELHTTLVKNELLSRIEGMDLSKEERDQLLSSCMNDYRRWVLHNFSKDEFFVRGNHNNSSDTEASTFVFSKELSLEIYNKSFEGPLEALKKLLKSWAVKDGTTAIALTGGTFLNPHVRGEIRKFIKSKRKLEYISWAEDNAPAEGWSSIVGAGAALAVINEISVQEFLTRAEFAVQVKERLDGIQVLRLGCEVTTELVNHHGSEVVIICRPSAPQDMPTELVANQCYDLEMLGREKKGLCTRVLSYEHHPEHPHCKDWLVFKQNSRPKHGAHCIEEQKWPVFYDAGSCVLLIERDVEGFIKQYPDTTEPSKKNTGGQDKEPPPAIQRSRHGFTRTHRWRKTQGNPGSKFWEDNIGKKDRKPQKTKEGSEEGCSSQTTERRTNIDAREDRERGRQCPNIGNHTSSRWSRLFHDKFTNQPTQRLNADGTGTTRYAFDMPEDYTGTTRSNATTGKRQAEDASPQQAPGKRIFPYP